jgi:hypothetical protein
MFKVYLIKLNNLKTQPKLMHFLMSLVPKE